jgi:hypothetical protein
MKPMVLALAVVLLSAPQTSLDDARLKERDGRVISAALSELWTRAEKMLLTWEPGSYVAVQPTWSKGEPRGSFNSSLRSLIDWQKRSKGDPHVVRLLESIRSETMNTTEEPLPSFPLAELPLDSRLVLTDKYKNSMWRYNWRDGKVDPNYNMVKNHDGKVGRLKTSCHLSLPTYSWGGRYAIVSAGMPWSMHSADVSFVLKLTGGRWKTVAVSAVYFV